MPDQDQTATVVQCHACQKRLKYSGRKPYVNCPGCGESVPVPDNIREGQDIQEVIDSPPVQTAAAQSTTTQAAPVQSAIDEPNWQVARGQERFGPFTREQVLQGIASGRIASSDFLWNPSLTDWKPASALFPGQVPPELPPAPMYPGSTPKASTPYSEFVAKKLPAGICAIFFGGFGVHKFILGLNQSATIMLCVSLFGIFGSLLFLPLLGYLVMIVIGIVEGITYISCSDAEFHRKYSVEKKAWF